MLTVVYSSIATEPFGDDDLAALLATSRDANAAVDVTGVLFSKNGYFLQLLEGPDEAVLDKMRRITADSRHDQVRTLLKEPTTERRFPDWTMAFAPTDDARLTEVPGFRTTFAELDEEEPGDAVQPALRALVRWFQEHPDHLR